MWLKPPYRTYVFRQMKQTAKDMKREEVDGKERAFYLCARHKFNVQIQNALLVYIEKSKYYNE